jgi:hypothetical protein
MFRSRRNRDSQSVTCIACGTDLPRANAREYDKHGDRWNRSGKEFEYLCKPCYRDQCHQPRDGLESLLEEIEADTDTQDEFLEAFDEAVAQDKQEERID